MQVYGFTVCFWLLQYASNLPVFPFLLSLSLMLSGFKFKVKSVFLFCKVGINPLQASAAYLDHLRASEKGI